MSELRARRGRVSRQHEGSRSRTVLAPTYERRDLRIAHGIQFHPNQVSEDFRVAEYVNSILRSYPNVERVSDFEYRNHRQRVIYLLRHSIDKEEFRRWLMTPGVMVIYNGHARNGRGPCFGHYEERVANEEWGEGLDRLTTGQFRMGFPIIGVKAKEITDHGYTAHLLKESEPIPSDEDCHPEVRTHLGSLVARAPEAIGEYLAMRIRGHVAGDRYWTYRTVRGGPLFVLHHAGWDHTVSAPSDWGCTDVLCRAFCHFGCSTFVHNYPVVRQLAEWRREGNKRYAYWTSQTAYAVSASRWVANMITYDVENAFESWEGVLRHAVDRTNRDLRRDGYGFRIR